MYNSTHSSKLLKRFEIHRHEIFYAVIGPGQKPFLLWAYKYVVIIYAIHGLREGL
jgi:hypothetical protein